MGAAFARVLGVTKMVAPAKGVRPLAHPSTVLEAPPQLGHARVHGHHAKGEKAEKDDRATDKPHVAADPLDPETRRCAQMGPPAFTPPPAPVPAETEVAPRARVSMEELLPQLVKRIAWAGDKRRGSVQLELGAGPHAGTVITVHADEGRVRVELAGDDSGALRRRLEEKGFNVDH